MAWQRKWLPQRNVVLVWVGSGRRHRSGEEPGMQKFGKAQLTVSQHTWDCAVPKKIIAVQVWERKCCGWGMFTA